MTQAPNTIGVQLSQAEVWFLMRTLNIASIPGLHLPEADEANMEAVDQLAFGALLARGLADYTGDPDEGKITITIDRNTAALVGTGALCSRWLIASITISDATELETYVYFNPHLTVVHSQPRPGIHLFAVVNSGDMLFSALFTALQLENLRPESEPTSFVLPIELIQNAHASSQDELIEQLLVQSLSTTLAQRFAVAVHGRTRRVALVATDGDDLRGIHILEDEQAYWIFNVRGESVFVQEASTPDVMSAIQAMLDE